MGAFRAKLDKRYGQRLVRTEEAKPYVVVSTGSLTLDYAMRTGGYIQGRIHEVYGPPGVCKTTLSILSAVAHQQKFPAKAVGWVDMERSFDIDWAKRHGLDVSEEHFTLLEPDHAEDVADMVRAMCETGLYSAVVVDSIGGMESAKAFEKEAGDAVVGRNAQVITRMSKHVAVQASNHKVTIILINQPRANLAFAGQDIPSGPRALKHATTFQIVLSAPTKAENVVTAKVNGDEIIIGRKYVARVTRSRVGPSGHRAEFWMFNQDASEHDFGLDIVDEATWMGIRTGVIEQKGAFYTLPTGGRFQGREKLSQALRAEPEALVRVRELVLAQVAHEVVEEAVMKFEEAGDE
jgi:recombination protein RecA